MVVFVQTGKGRQWMLRSAFLKISVCHYKSSVLWVVGFVSSDAVSLKLAVSCTSLLGLMGYETEQGSRK